MNNYSHLREYFINLTTNQIFPHSNFIQLQTLTIVQLTHELSPLASVEKRSYCSSLILFCD
jgi:hypothetical protein